MVEAAGTSEMLVNFYQTTWRSNPEDSRLYIALNFTTALKPILNRTK
jgi:hypothetical protein